MRHSLSDQHSFVWFHGRPTLRQLRRIGLVRPVSKVHTALGPCWVGLSESETRPGWVIDAWEDDPSRPSPGHVLGSLSTCMYVCLH
jgi:hypothetical protein